MTSHIAIVTWLLIVASSNEREYVHILVHINQYITKDWNIHKLKWSMNCHKEISYLYWINNVFKLCNHRECLVTAKYNESKFKKY